MSSSMGFGSLMMLSLLWSNGLLNFDLLLSFLLRVTVWMRLPDLPPALWTRFALELIVAAAGHRVRLDEAIELLSKGRYARLAVEIDLARPLIPGSNLLLEGYDSPLFWQKFEFEHIHLFCGKM